MSVKCKNCNLTYDQCSISILGLCEDCQYDAELEADIESDECVPCSVCNGSGEGMYDGTRCYKCRGSGVEK